MNKLEEELLAIQHSIVFCKKQYEEEQDPTVKKKIMEYIKALEVEEITRLEELNRDGVANG